MARIEKMRGKMAEAVLSIRIWPHGEGAAAAVMLGFKSYVEAMMEIAELARIESEKTGIIADCEGIAEQILEDQLRIAEAKQDEVLAHLMALATAMKAEGHNRRTITSWVMTAAYKRLKAAVSVRTVLSVIDAALRDPAPDDAEPANCLFPVEPIDLDERFDR